MEEITKINEIEMDKLCNPKEEWVKNCKEWMSKNRKLENKREIRFQYLHSDFYESNKSSLPQNLHLKKDYVLTGCYLVQINFISYLNKSVYSQYTHFKNCCGTGTNDEFNLLGNEDNIENIDEVETVENENTNSISNISRKSKSTRVLQITDGKSTLLCVELRPINFLNKIMNLVGYKCILKGSIKIYDGQLYLENHNIEEIGGYLNINSKQFYKLFYENIITGKKIDVLECNEINNQDSNLFQRFDDFEDINDDLLLNDSLDLSNTNVENIIIDDQDENFDQFLNKPKNKNKIEIEIETETIIIDDEFSSDNNTTSNNCSNILNTLSFVECFILETSKNFQYTYDDKKLYFVITVHNLICIIN